MNATLELQLTIASDALAAAASQNRIDQAKFALGLIAGAVSSAVPEEDRSTVFRIAMDGNQEQSIETVLDCAVYLKRFAENAVL